MRPIAEAIGFLITVFTVVAVLILFCGGAPGISYIDRIMNHHYPPAECCECEE
ncbi:MAG: hypothetical protein ACXABY_16540 [Candidatus Thorarchaeota archaeon]|jgi:hypothetical protein